MIGEGIRQGLSEEVMFNFKAEKQVEVNYKWARGRQCAK